MKTILVTGSAGFIGSNLVLRLFKEMSEGTIVGLDNLIRILCFCTFFQILRHYVWRFRILFLFLQTERRGRGYVPPSFFGGIFNLRLPNMLIANVLRFDVRRVNMDWTHHGGIPRTGKACGN